MPESFAAYSPEEFLEVINKRVCIGNGYIGNTYNFTGGEVLSPFEYNTELDLIIKGPCSSGREVEARDYSWMPEAKDLEGKRVLLFPTCCGSYSEDYINGLLEKFSSTPNLTFVIPEVEDLYDNFPRYTAYTLGAALAFDGILKKVLTEDEQELVYGQEPVVDVLTRMGITRFTEQDQAALDRFNRITRWIFKPRIQEGSLPVRYLLACDTMGLKTIKTAPKLEATF